MHKKTNKSPSLHIDEGWSSSSKKTLPNLIEHGMVQKLLDLLEDGIIIHDEKRKILLVNQTAEKLTGATRDEILGANCHEVFPPSGLCGSGCAFKDNQVSQNLRREHEVIFTRPDGIHKRIRVKSTPMLINKRTRGVLAVVRDLTELSDIKWQLEKKTEFHGMIGVSQSIGEVFETIRAVGSSDYPVLITGESGTGKELAAGAIHRESTRKAGPFVPVNCGALPENILESELFGHVRGAFTGAIRDKKGRFELADGGTIFLDEVGELPLHMQAKLLRVLQEKVFERVGGEKSVRTDVRIIAATNRDLRKMIQEGEFREDLFYRICVVPIELPPLRERKEDIPHLTSSILQSIARETGKTISRINDEAMGYLMAHDWPGNVRELINTLQFTSVRCKEDVISARYLPFEVRVAVNPSLTREQRVSSIPPAPVYTKLQASSTPRQVDGQSIPKKRGRRKLSYNAVSEALIQTGGNRLKAAKLLGVGRATLYRFLDENPALTKQ